MTIPKPITDAAQAILTRLDAMYAGIDSDDKAAITAIWNPDCRTSVTARSRSRYGVDPNTIGRIRHGRSWVDKVAA
jgi:hypothetical protein